MLKSQFLMINILMLLVSIQSQALTLPNRIIKDLCTSPAETKITDISWAIFKNEDKIDRDYRKENVQPQQSFYCESGPNQLTEIDQNNRKTQFTTVYFFCLDILKSYHSGPSYILSDGFYTMSNRQWNGRDMSNLVIHQASWLNSQDKNTLYYNNTYHFEATPSADDSDKKQIHASNTSAGNFLNPDTPLNYTGIDVRFDESTLKASVLKEFLPTIPKLTGKDISIYVSRNGNGQVSKTSLVFKNMTCIER